MVAGLSDAGPIVARDDTRAEQVFKLGVGSEGIAGASQSSHFQLRADWYAYAVRSWAALAFYGAIVAGQLGDGRAWAKRQEPRYMMCRGFFFV